MVEAHRKSIELGDIEARLSAIKKIQGARR
jgi:hypothetical protein